MHEFLNNQTISNHLAGKQATAGSIATQSKIKQNEIQQLINFGINNG